GVSEEFLLRTKSGALRIFSNCAIAIDVADCEAWQDCAALVIEPVSSTAKKYCICRRVTSVINAPDKPDQINHFASWCVSDHTCSISSAHHKEENVVDKSIAAADLQPRIVALGTAGGPRWWTKGQPQRSSGIATAVVVGDVFYLVDCGHGTGRRINEAGLDMKDLRAVFLTHLHSDHTVDLGGLALFGLYEMLERSGSPVKILGPGDRGVLPQVSSRTDVTPEPLNPANPTPGTRDMFRTLMHAHATDLNDRILDSLRPNPLDLFQAEDIVIPDGTGYHPNENP